MAAHFERQHRDREGQSDPEPPRHVDQFGVWAVVRGRPSPAPAPCRRSGRRQVRLAGSADASGRCRSSPPARASAAAPRLSLRDSARGRRRISRGSLWSRNSRSRPRARLCAWLSAGSTAMPQTGSRASPSGKGAASAACACEDMNLFLSGASIFRRPIRKPSCRGTKAASSLLYAPASHGFPAPIVSRRKSR